MRKLHLRAGPAGLEVGGEEHRMRGFHHRSRGLVVACPDTWVSILENLEGMAPDLLGSFEVCPGRTIGNSREKPLGLLKSLEGTCFPWEGFLQQQPEPCP